MDYIKKLAAGEITVDQIIKEKASEAKEKALESVSTGTMKLLGDLKACIESNDMDGARVLLSAESQYEDVIADVVDKTKAEEDVKEPEAPEQEADPMANLLERLDGLEEAVSQVKDKSARAGLRRSLRAIYDNIEKENKE